MGGAAIASLVGGMGQGYADAQRRKSDDEYKKLLIQNAKTKIELESREQDVLRRASEGDPNAIRELVIRKNPILGTVDWGNIGKAPPETNIGMNYEEPTAPQVQTNQVTFPGALTGISQDPFASLKNLPPEVKGIINKETGMFDFSKVTGAREATINGQHGIQYYGPGGPTQFQPIDTPVDTMEGPPINDIKHLYFVDKVTKKPLDPRMYPPIPIATEQKRIETKGPGGERYQTPVSTYKTMGPPSQAMQGGYPPIPLEQMAPRPTLGPKPGQLYTYDTPEALAQAPQIGQALQQQKPGPVYSDQIPRGAIQTEPPESSKFILPEKLGDYYNPLKGQYLSDHPNAANMTHGERQKLGYAEVPKLSGEVAGKFTAAVTSIDEFIPRIEKELFPQGKFNQQLFYDVKKVASSNKLLSELGGSTPGSATYKDLIESAEAWVRAKTGAAMTDYEIEQAAKTFIGPWLTSGDAFKRGINNLKSLLGGYAKGLDPKGVQRAIETRKEQMIGDKKAVRLNGVWGWVD